MAFAAGTRFGVYEITRLIGVGGMGEVYRANDTRLGRLVAVKVLPERLLSDPERVARFEREAKMLAALNHPNIATVHGFETGDGAHALVMELVDGHTLAERLEQRAAMSTPGSRHGAGLPLDEALRIARQIALALEAAHEQGIIHRDLKPANIKIREDGTVKVLDFGLAKMLPGTASADSSQSPTVTARAMTKAGFILGTAAYMSPEQASGKTVNKRADIWAFGCVLFEMLVGRRAFDAEDVSDTLALVLIKDADFSLLPPDVPRPIRVLIEHCLIKDPRRRLADMSATLLLIDELSSLTASTSSLATDQIAAAVAETRRGLVRAAKRRVALAWVSGLVLAALAGLGAWLAPRPAPAVVRTMVTPLEGASLSLGGFDRDVTITPDGTRIVYRGVDQLLVRALDSLEPLVLPNLKNPQGIFVSPDGEWVGFFDGNSALWKVPISGGPAVKLTNTSALFPRGAAWIEDDTIVYAHSSSDGLWAVAASGGELPTRLTTVDHSREEREHRSPEALPGGRAVLFTMGGPGDAQDIAVLDLKTRTYKVLLRGGSGPRYVASGHLVYTSGASLLAVPFDLKRLVVTGSAVTLLEQPAVTPGSGLDGAVSRTGTLVYVPGAASLADQRVLLWVDRQGREEPVPAPPRTYQMVRLAPDGTRVALDIRDQDNDIWTLAFTSGGLTRLTTAPGNDMFPVWTSDGARVIFSAAPDSEGRRLLASRVADASAPIESLLSGEPGIGFYRPYDVSPDGSTLVLGNNDDLMALELRADPSRVPTRTGPDLRALLETSFVEQNAEVSPNGQWLAYQSNESGSDEIYVRPFPNFEPGRSLVSTNGGRTPLWARNGQELFYGTPDGAVMSVRVHSGTAWQHDAAVQVVRPGYFHAGEVHRTFDVSLDGERFLMIKQTANAGDVRRSIVVVQNWFEDLKRLAPTE